MHHILTLSVGLCFFAWQCFTFARARSGLSYVRSHWTDWAEKQAANRRSRADLLKKLDQLILNEPSRRMLRRLGIMAPLMGVLLTAFGFMFVSTEGTSDGATASSLMFTDILASLSPLYMGVCVGVALAIFNQILLHFVDNRGIAVRLDCEDLVHDTGDDPVNDALAGLAKVIQGITTSAEKQMAGAVSISEQRIRESSAAVVTAAETCKLIADEYRTQRDAMQLASQEFQSSLQDAAKGLVDVSNSIQAAIRSVGKDLGEASRLLKSSGSSVNESVTRFDASLRTFGQMATTLDAGVKSLTDSAGKFQESANAAMEGAKQVGTRLHRELNAPIREATQVLSDVCRGCEESTEKMKAAGETLAASAKSIQAGTGELQKSSESLAREVPALVENIKSVRESVTRQEKLLTSTPKKLESVLEKFDTVLVAHVKDAVRRVGDTVIQEIREPVKDSTQAIVNAAGTCAKNAEELAGISTTLSKSTAAVEGASQTVAMSASQLSGKVDVLDHTFNSLTETVAKHDESLRNTPRQLTEVVKSLHDTLGAAQSGLHSAASGCENSSQLLATASDRFVKSTGEIDSGAAGLRESADLISKQIPGLNEQCQSLTESIRKQQEAMAAAPDRLVDLVESVQEELKQYIRQSSDCLHASVTADVKRQIEPLVTEATAVVRGATGDMQARFAECVGTLDLTGQRLAQGTKSLIEGSRTVADTTTGFTDRIRELDQTLAGFAAQLESVEKRQGGVPEELVALLQSLEATLIELGKQQKETSRQQTETARQQAEFYERWSTASAARKQSGQSTGTRSGLDGQSDRQRRDKEPAIVGATGPATSDQTEETQASKKSWWKPW